MAKPLSRSFSGVGLPDDHGFHKLPYHPPSRSVVAHTRPRASLLPSHGLSIRHRSESHYAVVGDFSPAISVSSFVLSPTFPVLYFITFTWSESVGNVGGNWDVLYRFSLDTRQCEMVASRGQLVRPDHYQAAWLSELLCLSEDGHT